MRTAPQIQTGASHHGRQWYHFRSRPWLVDPSLQPSPCPRRTRRGLTWPDGRCRPPSSLAHRPAVAIATPLCHSGAHHLAAAAPVSSTWLPHARQHSRTPVAHAHHGGQRGPPSCLATATPKPLHDQTTSEIAGTPRLRPQGLAPPRAQRDRARTRGAWQGRRGLRACPSTGARRRAPRGRGRGPRMAHR